MYEPMNALATYYAPLFPPKERTAYFLHIFAECFGSKSAICQNLPRPLMCHDCIQRYIKNSQLIIDYCKDNQIIEVLNKIIMRFELLDEQSELLKEHIRASNERVDTDVMYQFLDINLDPYDPPSENLLNQCTDYEYQKNETEECCVVCLCDFDEHEKVKKLICNHLFHDGCIMKWFENHATCPICKTSLKENTTAIQYEPFCFLDKINVNDENVDENVDNDDIEYDEEQMNEIFEQFEDFLMLLINRQY
jgi:hypothetical protein